MGISKIIASGKTYIKGLTGGGDKARTGKVNFNIGMSFAIRAISVVVSYLIVPFSLKLLDTDKYGIWLAISSTVSWISILDIGLANGLRNKVGEYVAVQNFKEAKIAVTSTYAILLLIILPIVVIFTIAAPFINWNSVFNTTLNNQELIYTLIVVFAGLSFQFILKPITSILQGDQQIYKANQIQLICNFVPLIPIVVGAQFLKGSMVYLAIAQTILPVFVLLIFTIVLFAKRYQNISPSLKLVDLKKSKSLFKLSAGFFVVQIAGVFLYSTTELIVAREFGGHEVALYVSLYKYYSATMMALNIVLATYWSAFTNAYALKDFNWIEASIKKLVKISVLFVVVIAVQVLLVKPVFKIWVGDKITVPFGLSLDMAIYFAISLFTQVFTIVLNGTGKVKMQSIVSIITAILHIPVVLFFVRYMNWGISSIVYASILWTVIQVVIWRREINALLRERYDVQVPEASNAV